MKIPREVAITNATLFRRHFCRFIRASLPALVDALHSNRLFAVARVPVMEYLAGLIDPGFGGASGRDARFCRGWRGELEAVRYKPYRVPADSGHNTSCDVKVDALVARKNARI
jgi:hypothetical protein